MASVDESTEAAVLDQTDATKVAASCLNDPNFAIICVFLQKFGVHLKIEHPDFVRLQKMIEDTDEVHEELKQFFVRLLRKTRKSVQPDKLDSALVKFCTTYSMLDAWEVERFGYAKGSLAVKLRILKELLESQFEKNPNFRTLVSAQTGTELRSQPLGKDKIGNAYWCTLDEQCNLRVYQEHLDEETWKVVATNREEMVKLIACLRGNELVMPSLVGIIDEDSSSNSMPAKTDALQSENGIDGSSNGTDNSEEKQNVPNLKIKLNTNGNGGEPSVEISNGNKTNGAANDDEEDGDEEEEAEEEEEEEEGEDGEEEDDDDDDSAMSEVDELSVAASESSTTTKSTETQGSKRFSLMASKPPSNKLKLKVTTGDGKSASGKRRQDSDPESTNKAKRPTLMSSKATKSTVESDEEDSDDDDMDSEEVEDEEEEDDDDDDETDEEEDEEVGSAIEEPTMYVHGVGSGKANKCENIMQWPELNEEYDEDGIGEVIEEMTMFVYGEGSGHECDVGNEDPKATETNATNTTETKPVASKPMFFFGQAGCLKLSPMMKPATPPVTTSAPDNESSKKPETLPNEESSTSAPINQDASNTTDLPESSNNHGADETDKASVSNTVETITPTEPQSKADEIKSDIIPEQSSLIIDDKTPSTVDDNKTSSDTIENNATSHENSDATADHTNSVDTNIAEASNNVNNESEPLNAAESNVEPLSSSEILSDKLESNCSEALESESVQECGATNAVAITPTISSLSDSITNETQPDISDKSDQLTIETSEEAESGVNESEAINECAASQELVSGKPEEVISESSSEPADIGLAVAKDDEQTNATDVAGLTVENGANVPTESQISSENETNVSVAAEAKNDNNENEEAPSVNATANEKVESSEENGPSEIQESESVEPVAEVNDEAPQSQVEESNSQADEKTAEVVPLESSSTEESEQQVEAIVLPEQSTCSEKSESPRRDDEEPANATEHVESERSENAAASVESPEQLTPEAGPSTAATNEDESYDELSNATNATTEVTDESSSITSANASEPITEHLPIVQEKDSTSTDALIAAVESSIITPSCEEPSQPETSTPCKESVSAKPAVVSEKRKSLDAIEEPFVCKKVYVCGEEDEPAASTLADTKESTAPETVEEVEDEFATNVDAEEPQAEPPTAVEPTKPTVEEVSEDIPETPSTSHEIPSELVETKPKSVLSDEIRGQDTVPPTKCEAEPAKEPVVQRKSTRSTKTPTRSSKAPPPSTETSTPSQPKNRKRRISGPKARLSSESENDNFDPTVESPLSQDANSDDDGVGGKRIKIRGRNIQRAVRETVEQKRNIKDTDWSSDDNLIPNAKRTTNQLQTDEPTADLTEKVVEPVTVEQAEVKVLQAENASVKTEDAEVTDAVSKPADANADESTVKDEDASDDEPLKAPKRGGRPGRKGKKPGPKPKAKPVAQPKKEEPDEQTDEKPPPKEPKPDTRRKKRSLMGLDIAEVESVQSAIDAEPQVRQSRRIAQIKIREEADRRKAEEVALHKMKQASEKKKNAVTQPESESEEENSESELKLEKKGEKKKKKKGNKDRPWQTDSDDDASEHEEEDDDHYHERDERLPPLGSDHEFSPESDIEDVPTKRARTARKDKTEKKEEDSEEEEDVHACQKCGKNDHPEWILLCDKCDKGYHCSCLIPVLFVIPEGSWFCPLCQQDQLINELVSKLDEFDARTRQKEADEAQRQRILLTTISEANVLKDTKRDRQRARAAAESDESSDSSESSEESGVSKERKRDRSEVKKRRPKPSRQRKRSDSSEQSSNSDNSSDDEPIYKFRKRRQANVSYRFNEYDELINRAIKSEMDEVAGAGNLGRGKDISTIIEANKEKKQLKLEQVKEEKEPKGDDDDDSDDEPLSKQKPNNSDDDSDSEPLVIKRNKNAKKKKKLNSLDSDTEEDADQSDDDFKASVSSNSGSDDDEEATADSDSSSDSLYRKKKKKAGRLSRRRSGRERKKRFDADFIDDDSFDDEDDIPLRKKMKKKKAESDYSDFNDSSEEELEEDVDSDDLCDDSTDESDKPWSSSRKKSKSKAKPKPALGGKAPRNPISKVKKPKKKPNSSDDDSDSNEVLPKSRRTRGKKTPYLVDDDFDSSDDGIRPGVKRPDTPPEEREAFIKKQEEIKRKLAEQKKDDQALNALPQDTDSLSTIPANIIQSAKALDIDLKKSALNKSIGSDNDSNAFDDDLPEDFDPEEMDEDAIAKMMEEEEFAQQQLKMAGETIRNKKQKESLMETPKKDDKLSLDIASSVIMPNISPSLVPSMPFGQSLTIPDIPPSMYAVQPQVSTMKTTATTPKKRGRKKEEPPMQTPEIPKPAQELVNQFMVKNQQLPPLSTIQHTSVLPPHTKGNIPLNIPSIMSPHGLPPQLYSTSAIQHTSSVIAHASSAIPPQLPLPSMMQMLGSSPRGLMTSSLMDVQNTKLMNASELAKPPDDLFESPTKKRGRRKKITPTRDSLQSPPGAPNVTVTSMLGQQQPPSLPGVTKSPSTSILSERLTGNPANKEAISAASMPHLYSPSSRGQSSVITRLPKPPHRPFAPDQSGAQRFYPPGNQLPPHSTIAHSRPPYPNLTTSAGPRQPTLVPPHAGAHLPHPMYMRGQPSIYGAYPNIQPPMHRPLQSLEHAANPPQDFPGPYQNLPFTSYYAAATGDRRPAAIIGSFEPFDNKNAPPGAHPPIYGHPSLATLTTIRHPGAGAGAGDGEDERAAGAHPPGGDSSSEFSGLVSYFSSQQDLD